MINDKIEELYIKYHKEVYLYAYSLCKNHHISQDLTSDTFYKAYLSMNSEVEYIKYWLFRVCKNQYIDYLRKSKRTVEYKDDMKQELDKSATYVSNIIKQLSLC